MSSSKCLYFVHIVKTGGTSIRKFFNENNPGMDLYAGSLYGYGHENFIQENYDDVKSKYNEVYTAITLRDPVKHLVSYYMYALVNPMVGLHKTVKNVSFSEWIRSVPNLNNYYVRFLNSNEYFDPNLTDNFRDFPADYDSALKLLKSFNFVLDTYKLNQDMTEVLKCCGVDKEFNVKVNTTMSNNLDISKEDIEYIKKIRELDYKLLKEMNITLHY